MDDTLKVRQALDACKAAIQGRAVPVALHHLAQALQLLEYEGVKGLAGPKRLLQKLSQHVGAMDGGATPESSSDTACHSTDDPLEALTVLLSQVSLQATGQPAAAGAPATPSTPPGLSAGGVWDPGGGPGAQLPSLLLPPSHLLSLSEGSRQAASSDIALHPQGASLLEERGLQGLAACAVEDGSHFICPACGGVVPVARAQQHVQFWCDAGAPGTDARLGAPGRGGSGDAGKSSAWMNGADANVPLQQPEDGREVTMACDGLEGSGAMDLDMPM